MDLDDVADYFTKHRYYDRFDEKRWREELEEHPLLMTKAPDPNNVPPLVEAIRQLKYGEECNSPKELAEQYKLDGNEIYKQKKFADALDSYTKGINYLDEEELDSAEKELKSVLYSNRAACHVMMRKYQNAIEDCKEALRLDPNNKRAKQRFETCLRQCSKTAETDESNAKFRASK